MEGNRMFKKPNLKQCPFCGSVQIALEYYDHPSDEDPYWQICCDHCGAMSGKRYVTYDTIDTAFEGYTQAIEKVVHDWNMRINDDKISVIWCKDCKWWNPRTSKCENEKSACFVKETFESWFCADGEYKSGMLSDDITFCMEECDRLSCPRNQKNIQDHSIPHSFSVELPQDCPKSRGAKSPQ